MLVIRPYRSLSTAQRCAVDNSYDDLLAAAQQGMREGWIAGERDPLIAAARDLGLALWPALIRRLVREARSTTTAPLPTRPRRATG